MNDYQQSDTVIAALTNNSPGTEKLPEQVLNVTGLLGEITQQPQRQPLTGADIVNSAITKGLDDERFKQNLANAPTINNPQVLNLIGAIDRNKQLYAGGQRVLDLYAGKNPDELTDEDKSAITQAQTVMQAAQIGNDYIRRMAQDGGVELGLWGGTDRLTPEQSAYATGVNQIRLNKELEDSLVGKYGLNSDQFFERRYSEYRRNGEGHERATILAGRDASDYQADRMTFLDSTMNNFGITDGRFNQLGSRLKGMLAEEDAIRASVYNNDFATPKDEYNYGNQVAMAELASALGMDKLQLQKALEGQLQAQRDAAAWEREIFKQQQANNRNDKNIAARLKAAEIRGGNGGGRSGGGSSKEEKAEITRLEKTIKFQEKELEKMAAAGNTDSEEYRAAQEQLEQNKAIYSRYLKGYLDIDIGEFTGDSRNDAEVIRRGLQYEWSYPELRNIATGSGIYDPVVFRKFFDRVTGK